MASKHVLEINFAGVADLANTGARRAAAFLAMGQKSWSDDSIRSVQIPAPFSYTLLPDPLPEDLAAEIRQNFRIWVCGNCLVEIVQALSRFLDEYYALLVYAPLHGKKLTTHALEAVNKCKSDANLFAKLSRIETAMGFSPELTQFARGWVGARNALAHNHGMVRQRDCTPPGSGKLVLRRRRVEIGIDGQGIDFDQLIGKTIEKDTALSIGIGQAERQFSTGDLLDFTTQEMIEICFTVNVVVSNMMKPLEGYVAEFMTVKGAV